MNLSVMLAPFGILINHRNQADTFRSSHAQIFLKRVLVYMSRPSHERPAISCDYCFSEA